MAAARCQLELMGLPDASAYRRVCRSVLQSGLHLFSGFNIPNKKPGEPLLEWAHVLHQELPSSSVCVHYSLKHQKGNGDPTAMFQRFCQDAKSVGVGSILLVTGPRGPRFDSTAMLAKLQRDYCSEGPIRLGVAFNACLPSKEERMTEQARLVKKLQTGIVQDVWLNCGSDSYLLEEGVIYIRETASKLGLKSVSVFGSVLLPNEAQLQQMRERPWNGVHFSDEYLDSLEGMARVTTEVLRTYHAHGVVPIIESKVRNAGDLQKLEALLVACLQTPMHKEIRLESEDRVEANVNIERKRRAWTRREGRNTQGYPAAEDPGPEQRSARRWAGKVFIKDNSQIILDS